MILLAGESCAIYQSIAASYGHNALISQFFHHPWHGLHFWDLVQPAFMLMAGSAMYISWHFKAGKGISWEENFWHILKRCIGLLIFGLAIHCVYAGKLVWELWNVLSQLATTTLIAYLIIRLSYKGQLIFSLFLLVLTEVLYRASGVAGYDQPFTQGQNFGSYADLFLMGKTNSDGWVAVNFIPTAAHTIWGVLVGKLLISSSPALEKMKTLVIAGIIGHIIGYSLDYLSLTPIIKRISTTSFVLVSGGWVLLLMALLYWIYDIKQLSKYAWIFTVVGMNSIFIYLFFETIGVQWFNGVVTIFFGGVLDALYIPSKEVVILCAFATLFAEWYLCYWLYKKKIFFKV